MPSYPFVMSLQAGVLEVRHSEDDMQGLVNKKLPHSFGTVQAVVHSHSRAAICLLFSP